MAPALHGRWESGGKALRGLWESPLVQLQTMQRPTGHEHAGDGRAPRRRRRRRRRRCARPCGRSRRGHCVVRVPACQAPSSVSAAARSACVLMRPKHRIRRPGSRLTRCAGCPRTVAGPPTARAGFARGACPAVVGGPLRRTAGAPRSGAPLVFSNETRGRILGTGRSGIRPSE